MFEAPDGEGQTPTAGVDSGSSAPHYSIGDAATPGKQGLPCVDVKQGLPCVDVRYGGRCGNLTSNVCPPAPRNAMGWIFAPEPYT